MYISSRPPLDIEKMSEEAILSLRPQTPLYANIKPSTEGSPLLTDSTSSISLQPAYGRDFWVLWLGILVLATAIALDVQTVPQFQSYALSSLGGSAWLASFSGIGNFVNATARPPIARLADRYGHFQLFSGLIVILLVGFLLSASTKSIAVFAVGQCLTALGQVGIQFSQNIIVAENSALPNRALATALPMSPFAFTVFAVAPICEALLPNNWRLGYGIWAVIVPVASIPLLVHLWSTDRSRTKSTNVSYPDASGSSPTPSLDVLGLAFFSTSLFLIFLSSTPTSSATSNVLQKTEFILGLIILAIFLIHQLHPTTKTPILALRLLTNRTVLAGCTTTFLYFLSFSLYQPYLFPYLQIANHLSISIATNATLIFMFSSIIFGLLASLLLRQTNRYKPVATTGTLIRTFGSLLMLAFTTTAATQSHVYAYQAFAGAGMGIGSWVVQVGVQAAVSRSETASLLALYATFGSLGGFLGDAMSSTIFSPLLTSYLRDLLPDVMAGGGDREAWVVRIRESVDVALAFEVGSAERVAVDLSWVGTMRALHVWSLGVLVLACGVVWAMRDLRLDAPTEVELVRGKDGDRDESSSLLGSVVQ